MSYYKKSRGRLYGLGGVDSCGNDQVWDPNVISGAGTAYQITGQCMPRGNYTAAQLEDVNAYPGTVKSAGSAGSSGGNFLTDFFKGLTAATPAPTPPIYMQPAASSGISTTTLAIAGGAAVLLIAFIATRKD